MALLLGSVGAAVGYATVACWHGGKSDEALVFTETPQFHLWAVLSGTQFFLWGVGSVVLWKWLVQAPSLAKDLKCDLVVVVAILIVVLGPVLLAYCTTDFLESPLRGHEIRITVQIVVGVIATAPGVIILERIGRTSRKMVGHVTSADITEERRRSVRIYHERADHVIMLLAGLIALTVLSTSALQGALDETAASIEGAEANDFIVQFVVLFGLQLSGILAVLAMRAGGPLNRLRAAMVNEVLAEPPFRSDPWLSVHQKRGALDASLTASDRTNVVAGVAVLVPLGSALASAML